MPEDPYAYVVAAFQAVPLPDYVPGLEEPEQAPPSPVYIPYEPELVYREYIPLEDDVFLAEEQPLPAAASPTAEHPTAQKDNLDEINDGMAWIRSKGASQEARRVTKDSEET
nr:hypothetical protein [Tanacetum cinerariifolium]